MKPVKNSLASGLLVAALWLALPGGARAQWLSQTNVLPPGWSAVYLHVDASHATLDQLIGADAANPILEVWLWQPPVSSLQFVQSPALPVGNGTQWASWVRNNPGSALQRLPGNVACLVRNTNAASYAWVVKGRSVPPRYQWSTTGLNLLGFPTPAGSPPNFENFLTPAPDSLYTSAEIYRYPGGELSSTNPMRLFAFRTTPVTRGAAYWVRSGDLFNRYFGPFEVSLPDAGGVHFGTTAGQQSFRLRNLTATNRTVTLSLVATETAPAGQSNYVAAPPLLVRGAQNLTNLTYAYSNLNAAPRTFTLAAAGQPGSEVEIVLGLNRGQMSGAAGGKFAATLRFRDSLNLSQIDVPVTAEKSSTAGLWIGAASVNQVASYLKSFQKDTNDALVIVSNRYVVTNLNTSLGAVPEPMALRLIVHNDGGGTARLLQRVYAGLRQQTNQILATQESLLDAGTLDSARRISAAHLPWSRTNPGWVFTNTLAQGNTVGTTVATDYNDHAANPFVHTYHPDHDNRTAAFNVTQPQGAESYRVERSITLALLPPGDDFVSLTSGSRSLQGQYDETVRVIGQDTREFRTRGAFSLNRVSEIPTLTTP